MLHVICIQTICTMVFLKKGGSFPVVDDQNPLEGQGFGLDLKGKNRL